ncbi:MAG TPA: glutamine amidotransferase family protein [bacterium]|nr:glutamine amidotransferase family protein [bacterium]HPP29917.1 glutamine amidotransferase family protein [bacterium]
MEYDQLRKLEKNAHIPSGCGISGIVNRKGNLFSGEKIITSICLMTERGNGLGAGYAGYGIYPEFKESWCFHIMYDDIRVKETVEAFLENRFDIVNEEPIPVKNVKTLKYIPLLHRYFVDIKNGRKEDLYSQQEYILSTVMNINKNFDGACVFSSGKNMGIFKGVGNPEEIGEFYKIYDYKGYIWTAHNRFPTNTVGWWGGAHPFGILDWSVVHNGEISSYGINRRYLENAGYYCTLFTDTEVITYLFDLLNRKHKLDFEVIGDILAAPFWDSIDIEQDMENKDFWKTLRIIYSSALVNGPFAIIVANSNTIIGLNDRLKLRPLVSAEKGDFVYLASEESAIRCICRNPERVWMPDAGEPVIVNVKRDRKGKDG